MNVANRDVEMWEEQDENGDDDNLPIVRRNTPSTESSGNNSLSATPGSEQELTSEEITEDEQDENTMPRITRQAPPVEISSKTRLKLKVVAEWKWVQGGDDTCGICRMPFEACCVDCAMPGDGCPLVLGVCKHPFHVHCIAKWTEAQNALKPQCPLCRQEWRYAEKI